MVRYWRSCQTVDARSHPFEDSVWRREPLERRVADAAGDHLTARDKTPLVLSQILNSIEDRGAMHYCTVPLICRVIQYHSSGRLQPTPYLARVEVFNKSDGCPCLRMHATACGLRCCQAYNAALEFVASRRRRIEQLLDDPFALGVGPDISDPDIMRTARR